MMVRYVDIESSIDITKAMKCPKRVTYIEQWFKAAKRAIRVIPHDWSQWNIVEITRERIVMRHRDPKILCSIVIDRRTSL